MPKKKMTCCTRSPAGGRKDKGTDERFPGSQLAPVFSEVSVATSIPCHCLGPGFFYKIERIVPALEGCFKTPVASESMVLLPT